jgi:hypothetical protein
MTDDRTIDLTNEQADILRGQRSNIDAVAAVLGKAINIAAREAAEAEREFWDTVSEFAGVDRATEIVEIDWLRQRAVVKGRDATKVASSRSSD